MANWTDEETLKLIEIWGDDNIQAQLEGCRKNRGVFEKIVHRLKQANYDRTIEQCRVKMKKLKQEYKRIKDKGNKTGEAAKKTWRFYGAVNDILGTKPATKPPIVIDTLEEEKSDDEGREETTNSDVLLASTSQDGNTDDPEQVMNAEAQSSKEESEKKDEANEDAKKPRKRPTKADRMEKFMDTFMTKMVKAQEQSDKLFVELESKRMKFEEQLLEMQQHQLAEDKEREERQRREEREFQLKMASMMCGRPQLFNHPPPKSPMQDPFYYGPSHSGTSSNNTSFDEYYEQ